MYPGRWKTGTTSAVSGTRGDQATLNGVGRVAVHQERGWNWVRTAPELFRVKSHSWGASGSLFGVTTHSPATHNALQALPEQPHERAQGESPPAVPWKQTRAPCTFCLDLEGCPHQRKEGCIEGDGAVAVQGHVHAHQTLRSKPITVSPRGRAGWLPSPAGETRRCSQGAFLLLCLPSSTKHTRMPGGAWGSTP